MALSEKEQKWYGWSHRAIFGFEVGMVIKKGDVVCTDCGGDYEPGYKIKSLDDAKKVAKAFAEGVS